jgi:hypothetical protein
VRDAEFLAQQRARWATSGERLVLRILIRRRIKCLRAGTHTIGRCAKCGVHQ